MTERNKTSSFEADWGFDPEKIFEAIKSSPRKRQVKNQKQYSNYISTARRLLSGENGNEVKDELGLVMGGLELRNSYVAFSKPGVSIITNAFARKIFNKCYGKGSSEVRKFSNNLENFARSDKDRRSSCFAQLGGAIILRAGNKPDSPHFVGLELVENGQNQPKKDQLEATRILSGSDRSLMLQAANSKTHISTVKVHDSSDALTVQEGINNSELPGTWVDLSGLETEPCSAN